MMKNCQNCAAHGAEWDKHIDRSRGQPAVSYWSTCRRRSPEITMSRSISNGGWIGEHPRVPYGHWCLDHVEGEDSTAAKIVLGEAQIVDKPQMERME